MPDAFRGITRWPSPPGSWSGLGNRCRGRWFMFGDVRTATAFVDLTRWPPEAVPNRAEYAVSFDALPDGRVAVCSMPTQPAGAYAVRIHPAAWPANPDAGPAEEYPLPGKLTLAEVWCASGRVVTFDTLIARDKPAGTHRAYLLDRGRFVVAPGLPPVADFGKDHFGHQRRANGKVTLAGGEEILIWDGDGYEWDGKKFVRRWELGAGERGGIDGWASVPWGADGFFYLSDWKLMYARRGHKPVRVQPDAGYVLHLSAGPRDSVILSLIRNTKRHVARVWFPADGVHLPLMRAHLGWGPSVSSGALNWSAATGHVYLSPVQTFPDSELFTVKPLRPREAGYTVPKA